MKAISWTDEAYSSKDRTVLTSSQLGIPGLRMFGKHTMHTAVPPLPSHYHENCFEFTYITKGTITFSIAGTDYRLNGGDVFLTRPGEVHSTNLAPISIGEIYWFQLDVSVPDRLLFLDRNGSLHLVEELELLCLRKIKTNTREMAEYMERSFQLFMTKNNVYSGASYLSLFLYRLAQFAQESDIRLSRDMEQILTYIASHITEELPFADLARLCGLSVSQFKQKFKNQVGVSPRNYINFHKIEAAKAMLRDEKSVTQTAMDLSFNSSSYFAVVFKRYTACSPSEYQRAKQGGYQ